MTRVLITGARAPAALHLARLLHDAGCHVVMADSLRCVVSSVSRACETYVLLPAANGNAQVYRAAVCQAIAVHNIDLVIPTCEEVFHLAALWADQQMDVPLFAPDMAMLARTHSKFTFTRLAAELGLSVPKTRLLQNMTDLDAVRDQSTQLVFKPVWSRFGTHVLVCPRRVKVRPTLARPWVAQDFITGEEVSVYAFAHRGRVAGFAAYRSLYRAGKGAGIAFERDDDPAIAEFVQRFVTGTNWTGQVSFDLIRQHDGALIALECNPRATSGVHFFRDPAGFAAGFLKAAAVQPNVDGLQAVKAALWVYGPWQKPGHIWADLQRSQDVMAWPDDPAPARRQLAAMREFLGVALRQRVKLTTATTFDIAWDGSERF